MCEYPNLDLVTSEFSSKEDYIKKAYETLKANGNYIDFDSNDNPVWLEDDENVGAGIENENLVVFNGMKTYFAFDIYENHIDLLDEHDNVIMKIGECIDLFVREEDTELIEQLKTLSKNLTTLFEILME